MTPEQRAFVRWAITFARRRRVQVEDSWDPVERCSGCRREIADGGYTIGCRRCDNRRATERRRERCALT